MKKSNSEVKTYFAVVFQPASVNSLYCLINHNYAVLMSDLMRYTYKETVDSYCVGVAKDDQFAKTLEAILQEVDQPTSRKGLWTLVGPDEENYEVALKRWQRLAEHLDKQVDLGVQRSTDTEESRVADPNDNEFIETFGSQVINLTFNNYTRLSR